MFGYDKDLLRDYPNTVGGVIYAKEIKNPPSTSELLGRYLNEQQSVKTRVGSSSLSEIPTLSAWRSTFSRFGVNPTKYRSAPEALLRRLTKKGDIPSINTLVDIGNLVSIRYGIPVAVFDIRDLDGRITVCYANGTEHYTEIGSDDIVHPEKGEVVFVDESRIVYARRWCWKQSHQSAANDMTNTTLIVTEAQHENGIEDIERALHDLTELLDTYAGGTHQSTILTRAEPQADF